MKALMFPGQGSQYKGMGRDLFKRYAKETQIASDLLGYDLAELCINDPKGQLINTAFAQPALFVVNVFRYYSRKDSRTPNVTIGHSLGEYNALFAAGAFDFNTGIALVKKRGELMSKTIKGSMAAVVGFDVKVLQQLLEEEKYDEIDIVNFNTPTQTVIAGPQDVIHRAIKDLDGLKIKVIPLFVTSPFHSRYMQSTTNEFASFLKEFKFSKLKIPVISNVTASIYEEKSIPELLSRQIASPVLWTDTIRLLLENGVREFEEIGAKILTKMVNEIKNYYPTKEAITIEQSLDLANEVKVVPTCLGNKAFSEDYGVLYNYVASALYGGKTSIALVIRMAKAGMLAYLETGGMSLYEIEKSIDSIQSKVKFDEAYGMSLLPQMDGDSLEMKTIDLYLKKGIVNIQLVGFSQVTEAIVYYHASGLSKDDKGKIVNNHRILTKVFRPEIAELFMSTAPDDLLCKLFEDGKISSEQMTMAQTLPLSIDICVVDDQSNQKHRNLAMVMFSYIQTVRKNIQKRNNYDKPIRVGLAGGIGTPKSIAAAFIMEADFVMTESINSCTIEAGNSNVVKDILEKMKVEDTAYAPKGDMFETGDMIQVLNKDIIFPVRANKLYNLYLNYNSLDEIPKQIISKLEKDYFRKPISTVWEEMKIYMQEKGKEKSIIDAGRNLKYKMALVFRWYFIFSKKITSVGDKKYKSDFQIVVGPELGLFNLWVKGTKLEKWKNRHVDEIGKKLMEGAAKLIMDHKIK